MAWNVCQTCSRVLIFKPICMKSFFISLFIAVCANLSVSAQTKFSVSYNDTVSIAEPLKIKYIVEDDKEFEITPKPLKIKNSFMELLAGPYTSTYNSFKMDNGKLTTHKSIIFTYIFLCNKSGMYNVPSLTVTDSVGNEKSFTDDMSFYVSNDAKYRKQKDSMVDEFADIDMEDTTVNTAKSKILEIVAVVDKNKISLGDSIKCQIHLFTNLDVVSLNTLKDLEVDNAIRHEIPTDTQKTFKETIYKEMPVKTVLWDEYYLIPLQAGTIKIENASFKAFYSEHDPNIDPIEAFFNAKSCRIERDSVLTIKSVYFKVTPKELYNKNINTTAVANTRSSVGIVLDRSSSLFTTEDTLRANYYLLENDFMKRFLPNINRNYDLTIFAKHPYKIFKDDLEEYANSIKDSNNDGSAVYDAILSAITDRETGKIDKKSIILLTDGSDNCSRISANTLTNILLENGIRVDVVAFASKMDSVYYVFKDSIDTNGDDIYDDVELRNTLIENGQNLDNIKEIATATGGVFIQVCNETQLSEAIQQIQNAISFEKRPLKKPAKMFKPDRGMLMKLFKEIYDVSKIPL